MFFIIVVLLIILALTIKYFYTINQVTGSDELTNGAYSRIGSKQIYLNTKANDVYNVGSISKSVTAYLCAILHEKRIIDVNDPISKYKINALSVFDQSITLKQLLNHTSGLSDFESGINGFIDNPPTLEEILLGVRMSESAKKQFPDIIRNDNNVISQEALPGSRWKYSGANYVVVQLILENILKQSFEDIVREYVFTPLQMGSTFDFNKIKDHILTPHWKDGSEMPHYKFSEHAAAGLYTTLADLLKFVNEVSHPTLISKETSKLFYEDPLNSGYGMGFMLVDGGLAHSGTNWGWKSYFYANNDKGFVFTSNYQKDYSDWIKKM